MLGQIFVVPTPFMKSIEKVVDGLFVRPEIAQ
jgi:hypothetical protein